MLRITLIGLALLAVGFVTVVSMQPSEFRVARSTAVAAPPAVVFAQVNDLHAFQTWSPFAKRDPAAKTTYDGPAAGPGSAFSWESTEIGSGRMTITDSRPHEIVRFRLDFTAPFQATNTAEFTFTPQAGRTTVTWSMAGRNGFLSKAVHLFMDMDAWIGGDFEKGLADLKAIAESRAS